jgi:hypothetical protein
MPNLISELTKNCESDDCAITSGYTTITCMGWTPTYDKRGNLLNRNPNTTTASYRCTTCKAEWIVKSGGWQGGPDKIDRVK